jgi:hypothetical protein
MKAVAGYAGRGTVSRARAHSQELVAIALLVAALSCGGGSARAPAPEDPTDVTLQVISHNFNQVDVYLYRGRARRLLGTASGHSINVFRIPWREVAGPSPVAIIARSIGDSRVTSTGALLINPGSLITWTIEPDLRRSIALVH